MFYVLNDQLEVRDIIDGYESIIWTENFADFGNIEIDYLVSEHYSHNTPLGSWVFFSESTRIMKIESIIHKINDDGKNVISCRGREISSILEGRVARLRNTALFENAEWIFKDSLPQDILFDLFEKTCISNPYVPARLPNFIESTEIPIIHKTYPSDTNVKPSKQITYATKPQSVYQAMLEITKAYPELGWRMYRVPTNPPKLTFEIYSGCDRTWYQNETTPIVFSSSWGSLSNTESIESVAKLFNMAQVASQKTSTQVVRRLNNNENNIVPSGFDLHITYVEASEETLEEIRDPSLQIAHLYTLGESELERYSMVTSFTGEVPPITGYIYGKDYNLGDVINITDGQGYGTTMRITQNVYSEDREGVKNTPGFEQVSMITPGTWSSLIDGETWSEIPGFWKDYR